MTFVEKLRHAQKVTGSMLCGGMDLDIKKFPESLLKRYESGEITLADAIVEYATNVIRAISPYVCAFKPNLAFYEALGPEGLVALERICAFIKENYPDHVLIVDGKRGDIGDTAKMYALAYLRCQPDAVTVNPYMGTDTVQPYIDAGLNIFVLGCTTNPGASQIQKLNAISSRFAGDGRPVYVHAVDAFMSEFAQTGQLGFVAGATQVDELGEIRKMIGMEVPLLIPGIGRQKGDLEGTLRNNGDGPAVINVSSKVCHASLGDDYAEAAGNAAKAYNDQVNALRQAA